MLVAIVAALSGLLAAARVRDVVEEAESRTGDPVPVVVAARDIGAGRRFDRAGVERLLALREVPARYVPRDGLVAPRDAVALETAVPVARGAYLTSAMLRDPRAAPAPVAAIRRGQRLVEVAVRGGHELARAGGPARVDVVVTTDGRAGAGRTFVALEDVELLAARPARAADTAEVAASDTVATLRVGARAAVFLTAAQNFARELRLLARPAGDRGRVGRSEIGGRGL